jgi:hypothetical protein
VLRRTLFSLLAVMSALGLAVAGRIVWIGYGPAPGTAVALIAVGRWGRPA